MTYSISHFDELAALEAEETGARSPMNIWVPGEEVSVYSIEMPEVPQRKWADMVPWLLEDQLLRPAEELHFALGPELPENKALVFVVAKETLNQWLMMAESKGVNPQQFAPDYLALPIEDGFWTLTLQGSRLLVRTGLHEGFAAEASLGWQLLEMQYAKAEGVRIAALVGDANAVPENWRGKVQVQQGRLSWGFTELPPVNLLSGDYRPTLASDLKPWYTSIALGSCALLLMLVFMLVQSYQWQQDVVVVEEGIAKAYQELFNEAWRGSRSSVVPAAEARIRLMQHQYVSLQTSPIAELRALDSGFSSCTGCDMQEVRQSGETLSFRLKPSESLRSRLDALPGIELNWGAADEQGLLEVQARLESTDG